MQAGNGCAIVKQATLDRIPAQAAAGGSSLDALATPLRIVRSESDDGFFLLRMDAQGIALADTWHEPIEADCAQARHEFRIGPESWQDAAAQ